MFDHLPSHDVHLPAQPLTDGNLSQGQIGEVVLQSSLFTRTKKQTSTEISANAELLQKAGYISKLMAGVYSFLPLGYRVLTKVEQLMRSEMVAIGGQEILLPALHPKELWDKTGRWDSMDVLYKLQAGDRHLLMAPTHEEAVTPLVAGFVNSYRNLPISVFQFQTKFRNEPRARSGLIRCREFIMKDMYSFHETENDLDAYYDRVRQAYERIFKRVGIDEQTLFTYASGGTFSKFSHEFQTLCPSGEDTVFVCGPCKVAVNQEIMAELNGCCPECGKSDLTESRAIETANIFKLMARFSTPFEARFSDTEGKQHPILMGCYGFGPTRLMGTVVELHHDKDGIIWPPSIAPYDIHVVLLGRSGKFHEVKELTLNALNRAGLSVLVDDREQCSAGEKFRDSDLLGIPLRVVISDRSQDISSIEVKYRAQPASTVLSLDEIIAQSFSLKER